MLSPAAWGGMKTDLNPVSYSVLGRNTTGWYCDYLPALFPSPKPDPTPRMCKSQLPVSSLALMTNSFFPLPPSLNHLLSVVDPIANSMDLQWVNPPVVDDDWSGVSEYFRDPFHKAHLSY